METKELQPLFDYLDEKFAGVDQRLERVEKRLDGIETAMQSLAKDVKDMRDEHLVLYRRMELLEDWAKKVSEKLGIPLPR